MVDRPSDIANGLRSSLNVIVVGAGAAGLYTCLRLPSHLQVGLISKSPLALSASDWAQGGVAAVMAADDSTELHIQDTLKAGAGLCDFEAVKFLVERAPECIQHLIDIGVAFDRHDNQLALTLEAAHSRRRVLHAADTTGRAVVTTLTAQVLACKNVQVISPAFVLDLWLEGQDCCGVSLLYQNQIRWLAAPVVILATGGGGQVFAQTTNPSLSTGDGVAIAHRAGAIVRDLEFVQFHPTALTKPGAPRFLISEAVRGEGAHLVDGKGHRFAFDYHPAGELAPRDVVSRAIFSHLQATAIDPAVAHVWLDLRPIPADRIQHRFPNIIQVCREWGIDVFQEPVPVAPAAHYWMGGVACDEMNRTTIPGLFAVGETASTGVHGANRLASNSLLECLVFGSQFEHLEVQSGQKAQPCLPPLPTAEFAFSPTELTSLHTIRQELPRLVWQAAGICREGDRMAAAIAQINQWRLIFDALPTSKRLQHLLPGQSLQLTLPNREAAFYLWAETRNLLAIGYLILQSAAFRTESRGGHYRSDYPNVVSDWQVHTLVQGDRWFTAPVR